MPALSGEILVNVAPRETRVALLKADSCRKYSCSAPTAMGWSAMFISGA